MGRNFKTYRCGGYSSYSGHCGALDCETCHPGGARQMAIDEATEGLREEERKLEVEIASIEEQMEKFPEGSDEYTDLVSAANLLASRLAEVSAEIGSIVRGDMDDESGYDDDVDDRYVGDGEVNWESPY